MPRIMIADDTAFMRKMLRGFAEELGLEVIAEAKNGAEAVTCYTAYKPDLVTLDITMPEMDGIAAVKKIKEADKRAKIIMCTAMGQQAMVLEAFRHGAADFIVKPLNKDRVLHAFQKVLGL